MTLRHPALYELVACDGAVVDDADVGPLARAAQGVVEVDKEPRFPRGVVGEAEHAGALGGSGLAVDVWVGEAQAVVVGRGLLFVVAVARAIALVGLLVGGGCELQLSVTGHKEEVAEVGDAGAAEVCEAEAKHCGMVVLVSGGGVVVVGIGVGADLNASEGHLCAGVHVAVSECADERIDILCQISVNGRSAQRHGRKGR